MGQVGAGAGGRLCLQGGDWNSLKQLFNDRGGCQESPVQTTRAPLKDSLCSQPLPTPATPLFQRWKNSRGVKAPCSPNSPGLVRPLVQPSPPAALLPARLPCANKPPLCLGLGCCWAAAGPPQGQLAAFLLRSLRRWFGGALTCLGLGFFNLSNLR